MTFRKAQIFVVCVSLLSTLATAGAAPMYAMRGIRVAEDGDTFAVLVRGEGESSSLSQTAKGLVPGRRSCLQFATFDVKDVKANRVAPRRFAVSATLSEGAEIDKALSWVHVDERIKGRYEVNNGVARINLHHIVFTAKSSEVELKLDNAAASPGEELGVNYVSLLPYYAR